MTMLGGQAAAGLVVMIRSAAAALAMEPIEVRYLLADKDTVVQRDPQRLGKSFAFRLDSLCKLVSL